MHALIVMSCVLKPDFSRELLLVTSNEALLTHLSDHLSAPSSQLQLAEKSISDDLQRELSAAKQRLYCRWFYQQNVKASRKQVAPLVESFYNTQM